MTPQPSVSYSITIRLEFAANSAAISDITGTIEKMGGSVTALDVNASGPERMRVDMTVLTAGHDHAMSVVEALKGIESVELGKVSDRTFLAHLGGKLEVKSKHPIRHRDDLSLVYTPGVARVVKAIAETPSDARRLTIKRNTVAVVTDGSAILGLGDLGPLAALPVMEGKAALFKRFADIDAFPICLDATEVDDIVAHVKAIAPVFAGINLEDISAPRCFEIEDRLRQELDIPVFHDDQHGTAVCVVSALRNALRVVEKDIRTVRIVLSGAGAAGTAILRLLKAAGAEDIVVADIDGVIHSGRKNLTGRLPWIAGVTNPRGITGTLKDAVKDADVFIGVSAANILDEDDIAAMADRSVVFAMANPEPEIDPVIAARHAEVVATGRSDFANQINNVLAFPGVFRGLLDARAKNFSDRMLLAAAEALADVVSPEELNPNYIIPSVFNERVTSAVADAVEQQAREEMGTVDTITGAIPAIKGGEIHL
ncbi:NAD-dependent malic enzyme [Helcobacillus massiliensis]|uniref:Malate dehydrogenase (Oxaloacetate-decarboxylating) n=1 Tax=Helcobacillus massiliensis TaxID=521392 RepID=A0A839QQW5_9MICO|nr:NAD-dependent malic enzyme [Helcobacillus massiliensis]MBB3022048.1 malate dehydrogenase (oxaloacetate-decarboxylating) [Helcobacillus massiliensis]MCT1557423.1 NAD-dependent malic enzyme [Helcobacillus massiliensis]MCT2036396.1 NAD-dependent malic enzyme [Helcobacillus massiliensis]MCT2331862.1 NAD-dependent malic enzyme [Helcobacillus massiliensis]MDK7742289.1 NAD-dependent malic enzyme [Helcobacillus massiliensis]